VVGESTDQQWTTAEDLGRSCQPGGASGGECAAAAQPPPLSHCRTATAACALVPGAGHLLAMTHADEAVAALRHQAAAAGLTGW